MTCLKRQVSRKASESRISLGISLWLKNIWEDLILKPLIYQVTCSQDRRWRNAPIWVSPAAVTTADFVSSKLPRSAYGCPVLPWNLSLSCLVSSFSLPDYELLWIQCKYCGVEYRRLSKERYIYCKRDMGMSLVVRWLGLCASTAGGTALIPGQGTQILHKAL